ncbi:MAG TPA: cysteine hydrolase family protein [Solirubrobacteraceae bacterium]|nr:cysteine hydrolase family protein [Solirubrobacteraceae bacterium]HUA72722.1 cysteine hydrolase family protein [Solirubrobacteraceae bacterium]
MADALVVIDIQNEYFPGGAIPLPDADGAARRAAAAIEAARGSGIPVIHIRHEEPSSDEYFVPGSRGAETNATVAPADGETVIVKNYPNSFRETDLSERLQDTGASRVAFCGMMTSMCVDATVRAAADLGLEPVLIDDACAAPALQHHDRQVPADAVHAAFCAALGDEIATVLDTANFSAGPADA